jgi:outer membrane lipase/esterase
MRHTKLALAAMTLAVLAGCGGTSPEAGNQTLRNKYSAEVVFGDSLSDVGSYSVGTVAALKGGKFTINGDNTAVNATLTGKNWTELMAAQLGLSAPCAAQTGLDGNAAQGFSVPVANHAGCTNYAQGGARVTNPVGPGNKLTGSALGALTVPLVTQVASHLAVSGGKFKGDEMVLVMAGANDVFIQLAQLSAAATAAGTAAGTQAYATSLVSQLAAGATDPAAAAQAIGVAMATESARAGHTDASVTAAAVGAAAIQPGNSAVASQTVYGPMVVKATADATAAGTKAGNDYGTAHGPELIAAMTTAGNELAALVKTKIVANGANFVTVNNLPDIANTPFGKSQSASTQALIAAMDSAFNAALASGLANEPKVLLVDVFAIDHDQATNPGPYGLTNVTTLACDMTAAKNPLSSSVVCNGSNLIAGDVSHYKFADTVHPTPFTHLLLARYVAEQLVIKRWL